jgi:endo-1,4-beta-D-glucanase Y
MKAKQGLIKKGLILGFSLLMMAIIIMSAAPQTSASSANPYLWPYNQPTSITFNEADVYQAWTAWRDAQITSNNAGGNGRYRVMGGVDSGSTVSEGQAYGILFSSIFDEQTLFDGLFLFAKDHYNEQGVMDWHIGDPGVRIGSGGATDAEVDMALGLVNACVKVQKNAWSTSPSGVNYCTEATNLINAIYTYEVDHPGSNPPGGLPNNQGNELLPGDTWDISTLYPQGIINLSYFPPGYFTVFGKFTNNEAAWNAVIDRNYDVVDLVQAKPDNCSGLVPNWNKYNGDAQLVSWQTNNYSWWSYDAARFAWRIAVDQTWYGRPEATETMNEIGGFFSSTGFDNIGEHSMNGQRVGSGPWPFFLANAGSAVWAAPSPNAVNCGTATGTLKESPQSAYNRVRSANDSSYYNGAWRLFAMLLMTGNFPNFYEMTDGNVTPVPTTVPTNTPVGATNTPIATATTPAGTGACAVDYVVANSWGGGFQANVTITNNTSSPINGYDLAWTHAPGQVLTSGWNVTINQSGNAVTASNPAGYWNGVLSPNGGTSSFGFQGTLSGGSAVVPTDFVLNGTACNDDSVVTPTSVPPTATSVPPTATAVPPTATSIPPTATLIPEITPTDVPPTATSVPPTATVVPPTATSPAGTGSCSVDYVVSNDWGSGFTANVTINNTGSSTINGWNLAYTFSGNQAISNAWNGTVSQSGNNVTVTDAGWNGTIAPNGSASFGFQAAYSGSNAAPTIFTLNGSSCN